MIAGAFAATLTTCITHFPDCLMSVQPLHFFLEQSAAHSHRDVGWDNGIEYRLHFFQYGEFIIWGLTAGIMILVAQHALGRQAEFEVDRPGFWAFADIWHDGSSVSYRNT